MQMVGRIAHRRQTGYFVRFSRDVLKLLWLMLMLVNHVSLSIYRTLRPASSDVFYTRTYSTTKKWDGVSFDKTPMTTHTQRVPSFHSNISKYLFKFSICVVTQTQTNKWENVSVGKKVKRRLLRESRDGWRFLPRRFWVISRKDKEDNVRRWLAGWNSTISVDEKMLPAQS